MKASRYIPVLYSAVVIALSLVLFGCENDETHWVAPANISGVWLPTGREDDSVPYRRRIVVSQNKDSVTVTYVYSCKDNSCIPVSNMYAAVYDTTNGLLSVQYTLGCWVEYYRFTSDTEMYSVTSPNDSKTIGSVYIKQ